MTLFERCCFAFTPLNYSAELKAGNVRVLCLSPSSLTTSQTFGLIRRRRYSVNGTKLNVSKTNAKGKIKEGSRQRTISLPTAFAV